MANNLTESAHLLVVSRDATALLPLWAVAEPNSWQVETAVRDLESEFLLSSTSSAWREPAMVTACAGTFRRPDVALRVPKIVPVKVDSNSSVSETIATAE